MNCSRYFWKLPLNKSRADALLNPLTRQWDAELQRLCELLELSAIAGTDETGWKVAGRADNAAVFASPAHTILLYGGSKGSVTLEKKGTPRWRSSCRRGLSGSLGQ